MYIVKRAFNNNVVMCINKENQKECILMGKGIGFGLRAGDEIKKEENIEKRFYLVNESNIKRLESLYNEVEESIIDATEESIAEAEKFLDKKFDERIHITLLDHINFSIIRLKNNIKIKNPFLHEIRLLYKQDFDSAQRVLNIINSKLNINLPEDESGFIAMHIHAAITNKDVSKTSKNTVIIKEMVDFIEEEIGNPIDKDGIDYARLITHLRFALDRIKNNTNIENVLLDSIKEKLKRSYEISNKMAKQIEEDFDIKFPEGEIGYISLHIGKIIDNR